MQVPICFCHEVVTLGDPPGWSSAPKKQDLKPATYHLCMHASIEPILDPCMDTCMDPCIYACIDPCMHPSMDPSVDPCMHPSMDQSMVTSDIWFKAASGYRHRLVKDGVWLQATNGYRQRLVTDGVWCLVTDPCMYACMDPCGDISISIVTFHINFRFRFYKSMYFATCFRNDNCSKKCKKTHLKMLF